VRWETEQSFDVQLCHEYVYQKVLILDNPSSSYGKKIGVFLCLTVYYYYAYYYVRVRVFGDIFVCFDRSVLPQLMSERQTLAEKY